MKLKFLDFNFKYLCVLYIHFFPEEQTNRYLNENSREVAEIIKPVIRETIEKVLTHYLRLCMNKIPSKCFVVDLKSVDYYNSIKKQ